MGAGSVVLLTTAVAFPCVAAAGPKPDLGITKLATVGLGTPPHLVIPPSGVAPAFGIRVTTTNRGGAKAAASKTVVFINDGDGIRQAIVQVPALGPGKSQTAFLPMRHLKPALGFARLRVVADQAKSIDESSEANNRRTGPQIAVEARQWNVNQFVTNYVGLFLTDRTNAEPGFSFRFSRYDRAAKQFVYQAIGAVKDAQQREGTCAYTGADTVTQDPWAKSQLNIAVDLKHYDALVASSATTAYQAAETCVGTPGSFPASLTFQDLTTSGTSKTPPVMKARARRLAASTTDGAETTWTWNFTADVP